MLINIFSIPDCGSNSTRLRVCNSYPDVYDLVNTRREMSHRNYIQCTKRSVLLSKKPALVYCLHLHTPPPRGTQSDELLCSQLNTINSFITNDIYIREVPFPLQRGRVCNGLQVFENINIILYGPHVYFNNRCFIKKVCLKITKPLLIESEY